MKHLWLIEVSLDKGITWNVYPIKKEIFIDSEEEARKEVENLIIKLKIEKKYFRLREIKVMYSLAERVRTWPVRIIELM